MNSVNLTGRLTRDPELKHTNTNEVAVCSFTIAVKSFGDKEDYFFNCVTWRNTAENLVKYQKKGNMIAVSGELQSRKYEKDGQNRTAIEVNARFIDFIEPKNSSESEPNPPEKNSDKLNKDIEENEEDLPF